MNDILRCIILKINKKSTHKIKLGSTPLRHTYSNSILSFPTLWFV